jgi:hypothetical protein
MSIDSYKDRTKAYVNMLINLKKNSVNLLKHKQGETDSLSSAPQYTKNHCFILKVPRLRPLVLLMEVILMVVKMSMEYWCDGTNIEEPKYRCWEKNLIQCP